MPLGKKIFSDFSGELGRIFVCDAFDDECVFVTTREDKGMDDIYLLSGDKIVCVAVAENYFKILVLTGNEKGRICYLHYTLLRSNFLEIETGYEDCQPSRFV